MNTTQPTAYTQSKFPPESAGRLMHSNVPMVREDETVGGAVNMLFKNTADFETVNYIYVVNISGELTGVVSIKELFRSPKTELVKKLSTSKKLISARTHTDQERVALLALRHNIKAIPVVDKENRLLGVVTSDVILNTLHTESIEDALRMAGAGKLDNPVMDIMHAGAWLHFRKRIPWLLLGLAGGIGAAFIVNIFEGALEKQLVLAAFIPAIVYMADAVGSQTQTIFVRSLALEHALDLKKYLWRELRVSVLLALLLSLVMSVFAVLWADVAVVGLILGMSVLVTVLVASAVAVIMPLALQKMKFDPAIASGPFATIVRDVVSLMIYFSIAWILL